MGEITREELLAITTTDSVTGCPFCGKPRELLTVLGIPVRQVTCGAVGCRTAQSERIAEFQRQEEARVDPATWKRRGGMPEEFIRASTADFKRDPTPESGSVLITGPVGVGKKHLAAAYVTKLGMKAFRWTSPAAMESSLFAREEVYINVPVLVLDNYGSARTDDHAVGNLHDALARRDDNHRTTIVTTNLSEKNLALDERIWSRLQTYFRIRMKGPDRRAQKTQDRMAGRKDIDG